MEPDKLLGEKLEGSKVAQFLATLGASPEEDEDDSEVFWDDPEHGLVLRADPKTRKINTIYLYFTGYEDYEDYTGVLPRKLQPTMTRQEVEALLGPGRDPTGEGKKLIWDGEEHNLSVGFAKDGRIRLVAVYT